MEEEGEVEREGGVWDTESVPVVTGGSGAAARVARHKSMTLVIFL